MVKKKIILWMRVEEWGADIPEGGRRKEEIDIDAI